MLELCCGLELGSTVSAVSYFSAQRRQGATTEAPGDHMWGIESWVMRKGHGFTLGTETTSCKTRCRKP